MRNRFNTKGNHMNVGNMTVKAKLGLAFGSLALLILLASGIAIKALNDANQSFENYVNGINARALIAAHRRGAARNAASSRLPDMMTVTAHLIARPSTNSVRISA